MVIREPLAEWVQDKYFAGGLTYSGHVLACASAIASIEALQEEGVVENAAAMGEVLGKGLFWGIELVRDRDTREPLVPFNAAGDDFAPMAKLMKAAMDRGLYLMTHWNV